MKNLGITLAGILIAFTVLAQDETLMNSKMESGGYGSPVVKIGPLNGETCIFVGGQGGWVINHRWVLGGKGYASVKPATVAGLQNIVVGLGCGGAFLEYIIASDKLVHFSVENMIGYGMVYNDVKDQSATHDPIDYTGDGCLILEPGVNAILNVTERFRVSAGANYRYVSGVNYDPGAPYQRAGGADYDVVTNADVSGFSAQIGLRFGVF